MGDLNPDGMKKLAKEIQENKEVLNNLLVQPFNLRDESHLAALKKYIDNFEFFTHQMYLFQATSTMLTAWIGSWAVSYVLPIPNFVNSILAAMLYLGAEGYILKEFRMKDFVGQHQEMQAIYNWALKDGKDTYDSSIKSIEKLDHVEIKRLIKAMAPFNDFKFMQAWPKVIQENKSSSWWPRWFNSAPTTSNEVIELQKQVETGALVLNSIEKLEKSVRYFATDPHVREMIKEKIHAPVDYVKGMIPEVIASSFSSHPKMA